MIEITETLIKRCSLTLGQFDSETVNLLVTLFHHQQHYFQNLITDDDLMKKFENLLTCKDGEDDGNFDKPLTRIELSIMIDFKQRYLPFIKDSNNQNPTLQCGSFSVVDLLNLAYCFLMAEVDDRLSQSQLKELQFLLNIRSVTTSLRDIYQALGDTLPNFFARLLNSGFFRTRLVSQQQIIEGFQMFIRRYEVFLTAFGQVYKSIFDQMNMSIQNDAIMNQDDNIRFGAIITKATLPKNELIKAAEVLDRVPNKSTSDASVKVQLPKSSKTGLCVIINIKKFNESGLMDTPERAGSDKDVDLIKVIFKKLDFTVLECRHDFTKDQFYQALDHVNDSEEYGHFECLAIFIMSHGLLHSFFTCDSKEVIIADIIQRFTDMPGSNIWTGKPRLFFIQACRSLWPEDFKSSERKEVQEKDLSPHMLIAYSCSPSEASKRSPTSGSIFIQILCIMVLRYGHNLSIQAILDWTARFVIIRDTYVAEVKNCIPCIQQPQYIAKQFNSQFRLTKEYLFGSYPSWDIDAKIRVSNPLTIWTELYSLLCKRKSSGNIVVK